MVFKLVSIGHGNSCHDEVAKVIAFLHLDVVELAYGVSYDRNGRYERYD